MAGTSLSAHTRLVPAVRRADTRAKTEPRRAADPELHESTSPYPRNFEAADEGRESLPYLELEIATDRQDTLAAHLNEGTTEKRPPLRVVKTVSRKLGVGTGTERAIRAAPAACKAVDAEGPTEAVAKLAIGTPDPDSDRLEPSVVDDDLELSTARVVKMLETLTEEAPKSTRVATEPNGPAPRPSMLQWLGVVLTQPEVGAALMIGTWLRPEFCVTSPVTHVFARGDGVLVQTLTKSRYFVGPDGDTYLVRKI
jgi:hypothetical protein